MNWATFLILAALASLAALANCSLSCQVSAPQIVLRELHSGCNTDRRSRHPDCVAAMHRFCNRVTYPPTLAGIKMGISREHTNQRIGMSCLQAHWGGDVRISVLQRHHSGCTLQRSQHRDCLAAIHRYCTSRFGSVFAGMSQEVGHGVLGVRCFRSTRKQSVSATILQQRHRWCVYPNSDSDRCFAAASRWCSSFGYSGGITQEVGNSHMTVACYSAQFSNDVFVQRISDFYTAQRRINNICNVSFAISQGRITQSNSELLSTQMYNNIDYNVPLSTTFDLSKSLRVNETNRFTHGQQLTFGANTHVSVRLPRVSAGAITSTSSNQRVSLTRQNSRTITYTHHSSVTVPSGHVIFKGATLIKANLNVPWTGRAVNALGAVRSISGQWTGVSTYFRVVQMDMMNSTCT